MRLTSFSNYALRTLMFAALKGDRLSTTDEISRAYRFPRPNVVKCVHLLGQWGYLENVRGRGGGFRLARPASEIIVGEVVRRTESRLDILECFSPETNTCPLIEICALKVTFTKALQAFLRTLDQVSIADVTTRQALLAAKLGIERPTVARAGTANATTSGVSARKARTRPGSKP
ncbi:MAG: Rrf2 family transcriptional regulator [Hyphomicrobiaceae bacterium]|nr:Rrf2 family transcriptional regulator [Hyphomicrobiaceae bacterium]